MIRLEARLPAPRTPLGIDFLRELEERLGEVERLVAIGEVRGLLLTAAPTAADLIGYDLAELSSLTDDELFSWSHEAHGVLRRLEDLPATSVAVIEGRWLGAGAELALACRWRIAAVGAAVRLGFPQTHLGLLPAWGGTVRLPRLIGLSAALDLVLSGRSLGPKEAARIGLVDRVVMEAEARTVGARMALEAESADDARGRSRPALRSRLFDGTGAGRRIVAARAARRHLYGTDADIAGKLALELMLDTFPLPAERAYARESTLATQLIVGASTRGRLHAQRCIEAVRRRGAGPGPDAESAAVLGSGPTASDLVHLLVSAGLATRMRERDRERLRTGVARARERLEWERAQARISEEQATRRAALLRATTGFGGFGTLELVVAAPDENPVAIAARLSEAAGHVGPDCVLGFHDWSASPTVIQRQVEHPERIVGLTVTFPADRFPLLEIAPGALTTAPAVDLVRRLARRAGLLAVVTSDLTPSPATRLLGVYFAEASRLLAEGATVFQIDAAATEFGFTAGPFHRMDAIGANRVADLLARLDIALGERMRPSPVVSRVARHGTFYRYRDGRPAGPNPALPPGPSPGGGAVTALIQRRILLLLINEATRILDEGVLQDPAELEAIALVGLGFPQASGGPLYYAQEQGLSAIVAALNRTAARYGDRYAPSPGLQRRSAEGSGFFTSAKE